MCVSGAEINYTYFCVYMSIPSTCVGRSVFSVGYVLDGLNEALFGVIYTNTPT